MKIKSVKLAKYEVSQGGHYWTGKKGIFVKKKLGNDSDYFHVTRR